MNKSVYENYSNGLCCSCGICKAICHANAITYERINGMFVPAIDGNKCVNCGVCQKVCPGLCQMYNNGKEPSGIFDAIEGSVMECWNSWSKDSNIRHISASGGVTTELIKQLLKENIYDVVFCVDEYKYDNQLQTIAYTKENFLKQESLGWKTPKSRYLPVSHESTIQYLLKNRKSRIVIIAVPCALQGICNIIKSYNLPRNNYLLIGLFCERNFQYNIYDYFQTINNNSDRKLVAMNFKNKESGGWPGNVKLIYSDGTVNYIDKSFRTKAKDFFQPECCMYCIDKLACLADIAIGDNYTSIDESELGSNSVIIRTERGINAWKYLEGHIEKRNISIDDINRGEDIQGRTKNYYFAQIKREQLKKEGKKVPQINSGIVEASIPLTLYKEYEERIKNIKVGEKFLIQPDSYQKELFKRECVKYKNRLIHSVKVPLSRVKRFILKLISKRE